MSEPEVAFALFDRADGNDQQQLGHHGKTFASTGLIRMLFIDAPGSVG